MARGIDFAQTNSTRLSALKIWGAALVKANYKLQWHHHFRCLLKSRYFFGDKILAIFCSKNQGVWGGARFRPSVRRPSILPPIPEFCDKNQAESADDSGGCVSALNGPIGTLDPTTTKPNRQLDGGEEKQQTHGGLLGTKLQD